MMRHHGVHGVHACRHVAVPGLCQPGVLWPGPFYGPTWPAPGVWGQHGAEGSIKALAKTTVLGQNHEEPWYSVKVVPEIPLISFTQNISEVFDQKKNHQTISDPLQALQATWLHCSSSLMCCLAKCRLLAAEELVSATSLARAPSKHLGWVRNGGWSLP